MAARPPLPPFTRETAVQKIRAAEDVRFAYEWHSDSGQWFRAHGNENRAFSADGLMSHRHASINDVAIDEGERLFHWDRSGPRPAGHPGLTELGL